MGSSPGPNRIHQSSVQKQGSSSIFKKYWGPLHIPRHILIFDDRNLRQALRRAHLVDIEMGFGLRTVGWSAGVQNLLADRAGFSVQASGRVPSYSILMAIFFTCTLIQVQVSKTAAVAFRAGKPTATAKFADCVDQFSGCTKRVVPLVQSAPHDCAEKARGCCGSGHPAWVIGDSPIGQPERQASHF